MPKVKKPVSRGGSAKLGTLGFLSGGWGVAPALLPSTVIENIKYNSGQEPLPAGRFSGNVRNAFIHGPSCNEHYLWEHQNTPCSDVSRAFTRSLHTPPRDATCAVQPPSGLQVHGPFPHNPEPMWGYLCNGGFFSWGRTARVCGALGVESRESRGGPVSCVRTS